MDTVVDGKIAGKTIREYCRGDLGFSSSMLKKLKFSENGILINGSFVTVRHILKEGEILSLALEDKEEDTSPYIIPVDIPIEILYSDKDLTAVNKPPNMPAHPSFGHRDDTVANALAYLNRGKPYVFRPVNRLDRDTSGVMLVANSKTAAYTLYKSMTGGLIKKTYIALLEGHLNKKRGVIESYMRRCEDSIIKREECPRGEGKYARTEYRVMAESESYSLVEAHPETGRTHQLRLHFASSGAPIVGDSLYGKSSEFIDRHALHASEVRIKFSPDSDELTVKAPLPDDIEKLCRRFFSANS